MLLTSFLGKRFLFQVKLEISERHPFASNLSLHVTFLPIKSLNFFQPSTLLNLSTY